MKQAILFDPKLSDIADPDLQDFYGIWLGLKRKYDYPTRQNFSPTLFVKHLSWIAMNEYKQDSDQFVVKVFGTNYVEAVGSDPTNKIVESKRLVDNFKKVITLKQPYLSLNNELSWAKKEYKLYNVIGCPLFHADKTVSHILFRVKFPSKTS